MFVSSAIWFNVGSQVVLRFDNDHQRFEALFFDGRHEAPAIHEVGITMAEALHTLADSLRDNGFTV